MRQRLLIVIVTVIAFALMTSCGSPVEQQKIEQGETISHIHGIGFSPDGEKLIIPVHDGLRFYSNNLWSDNNSPAHDFMGFAVTSEGFYSSGHPDIRTEYPNPLGLVKSEDMGKSLELLALSGEADFHVLAAGYSSHMIYVLSETENSLMNSPGMYYTDNDGESWTNSSMSGLKGQLTSIAVHPTERSSLLVGSTSGLFFSHNYGDLFKPMMDDKAITAVAYSVYGDIYAADEGNELWLAESGQDTFHAPIKLNIDKDDIITYIAIHPKDSAIVAVATMKNNIYMSSDNGITWRTLANNGVLLMGTN